MTTSQDHRGESRLDKEETIFIEVLSAATDTPSVVVCSSLDLSANGLQVVVDEPIEVNTVLRLCIDVPGQEPIFVVGETKWLLPDPESEGYRLGFLLLEDDDSDIQTWKSLIATMLDYNKYPD